MEIRPIYFFSKIHYQPCDEEEPVEGDETPEALVGVADEEGYGEQELHPNPHLQCTALFQGNFKRMT